MPLHLIKLCVGAETFEDQRDWCERRLSALIEAGEEPLLFHITRMVPKRVDELLDGGALYWVIKGNIQARQKLVDIRPFTDTSGIRRCKLMLDPELQPTQWQARRAFQGWRYLEDKDAPAEVEDASTMVPPELRTQLAELGLL
ncbi:MAG: DUF1489 family protein [Ahrensia sp.]|nr:DUF1489 family protein [Ahrensia sp.]